MRLKKDGNRKVCDRFHYPASIWRWLGGVLFVIGMLGLGAQEAKANSSTYDDTNRITVVFAGATLCNDMEIQCEPNDVVTNFTTSTPSWSVNSIIQLEPSPGILKSYVKLVRSSAITSETVKVRHKDANPRGTRGRYHTTSNGTIITDDSGPTFLRGRRTDLPALIKLDFNKLTDNNDTNSQPGFTRFIEADSGMEDVNGEAGAVVELSGNIVSRYRLDPNNKNDPADPTFDPNRTPIPYTKIYRDFICGTGIPPSGVTITVWGLGAYRDCNIVIYAFDDEGTPTRRADWRANGKYLFTTDYIGNDPCYWPRKEDTYAWPGTAQADDLGRIILTSSRGSGSPENEPFAFVNGLMVFTTGDKVEPKYAQCPRPVDGKENVPVNTLLKWRKGAGVSKHDLYVGADWDDVNNASRTDQTGVQIYAPDLAADANTFDPCGDTGFLELRKTYYWRVDENTPPDLWKGEVWSFTTSPNSVVDNFNSYADNATIKTYWNDYWVNNTRAEVFVQRGIDDANLVRDGNSMRYLYTNAVDPYYSEATATIGTGAGKLNIDPNWLGMGAKVLSLWFYGQPGNDANEQMYIKLVDSDNPVHTATVEYRNYGDMNDIRKTKWHKWNIALQDFVDNNNVNLANVSKITIGFGDSSPGNAGTVYFEDILLNIEAEVPPEFTGAVDVSTVYQELEGFGAAGAYEQNFVLGMPQPYRDNLYDTLFDELGLDIYRLRNTYNQGPSGASYINDSAQIIAAAKERNPSLKILISSWAPSANLKSNGLLTGGGGSNATLAKDTNDTNWPPYYYVYDQFAQWWADSLVAWDNNGVVADYVSMQNEPDYDATWESCRFNATENSTVAGYRQAFEAVYQKLYSQMGPNLPKLLAPETAGLYSLNTYIDNLIDRNHVYGFAHHLYNGGGSYNDADGFISQMTYFRNSYGYKPLLQTEFSKGGGGDVTTFPEAMNLAQLMHNSLVVEGVSAYLYWELFWEAPKGLVSFMGFGGTYTINPVYYAFKHYSAFTDPGWHRVAASTDSSSLRISAFKNPDNSQLTIVIINTSTGSVSLTLTLNRFSPDSSEVYQSTSAQYWSDISPFSPSMSLPAESITTIHLTRIPPYSNCDEVLAAGYGLESDLTGNCYVDLEDFGIVAHYWLNKDCASQDDCEGADFEPSDGDVDFYDLDTFVQQWLWCNDPTDPNCMQNWW